MCCTGDGPFLAKAVSRTCSNTNFAIREHTSHVFEAKKGVQNYDFIMKEEKKKEELGKKSKINFTCGGMECKKNRLVVIGGVGTGVFG